MNSKSKIEEIVEQQDLLQQKIRYQVKNYLYRKLSAQEEIADLNRTLVRCDLSYEEKFTVRQRILSLKEEIAFCVGQITAYENNDNKAKIVPDRCL